MKAVRYDRFEGPLQLLDVPDPTATPDGVIVQVGASRATWSPVPARRYHS
jgi:NADPH:quinone reductase-like Zn-dependent oxidoreductase